MPPEPPPSEEHDDAEGIPQLTDENVAILYQIVKSAQSHADVETLPFRAIFAAYETTLPENGLDPDHDQIYLRFLFRLGDRREAGQSLYQSFLALLEELGLQIELVSDEDNVPAVTRDNDTNGPTEGAHAQAQSPRNYRKRSRRPSLEFVADAKNEFDKTDQWRPTSRASMSRLDVSQRSVLEIRPSTRATTRRTEKTDNKPSPLKPAVTRGERGRLKTEGFEEHIQHHRQRGISAQRQNSGVDRHGVRLENRRRPTPFRTHSSTEDVTETSDEVDHLDSTYASSAVLPARVPYPVNKRDQLYQPSRAQLLRDADTFYHYHIRSVAREIVDKWCYAALQARDHREHLDRLAAAHDTEILLSQAFENWRARMHAKKLAAETERYFKAQERKIQKSRDLMLVGKAFSHWSHCALDERLRVSDARQRLLGLKYLHAWHSITMENQQNVRYQRLRKFFAIWKHHFVQRLQDDIKADVSRHENLLRKAYWQWFWTFCDRRAPEWRARRLRSKYLSVWVTNFETIEKRQQHATIRINSTHSTGVLSQWAQKVRVILDNQRQARAFDNRKQASHALQAWRRSQQYAPPLLQMSNMADWRIAGATFAVFVTRFRFEQQAAHVNRLRIVRNAWTQWNDRLRWQTIAHRIDDRYCLETLYKWVIAGRCLLLQRLRQERLKQRCLRRLHGICTSLTSQRERNRKMIEDARRKSLVRDFVTKWYSRLGPIQSKKRLAFEFHSPKVAGNALQSWIHKSAYMASMNDTAKHASLFFAAKRMIKRWQATTADSRRQKRKNAYVQVRRQVKKNLAQLHLQHLQNELTHVNGLTQQAEYVDRNRLLQIGIKIFDSWRDRSNIMRDKDFEANEHYTRRLLERHLYIWIEKAEEQARIEEVADLNSDLRVTNVAFSWFNKLRLRIIELKGQEANAENLGTWYEKRRLRQLLRRWHDKTATKLLPHDRIIASPQVTRTRPRAPLLDRSTQRAEEWTEFDIGDWIPSLEAQSSSTPLPGYLSTPSKRAARAKALANATTTPAGTPFEHRLRSQIASTPRTARRFALGGTMSARKGNTVETITENSPRTPNVRMDG